MVETAMVWFRRDCRLHDNPVLRAAATADELLPVYVFDPQFHGETSFGGARSFDYRRLGPHRARFLRETVADLRALLRERDSDLLVRHGPAAEALPALADAADVDAVYHARYPTSEEHGVASAVRAALPDDVPVETRWTHTLYEPTDLPMAIDDVPDTFTPFREQVEAATDPAAPVDRPELPPLPPLPEGVSPGEVPPPSALGVDDPPADDRAVLGFAGGPTAGLARLHEYVWERDRLRSYKQTRNGLLGADFSSKLSAWLAQGCLSPRRVAAAVDRYEAERVANESTYWLVFELTWRDYFQFQFAKHGDRFFAPGGIRERRDIRWRDDDAQFRRWAAGETGIPFVDANMRELNATGYMSNRGRQNVASFLANNLRIDWRRGAAYFERQLVDYDPCSNYGNWAYNSQVGNDSRDNYFNIISQAERYDDDAAYVRTWCPELEGLPPDYAHRPWELSDQEQAGYGVELGVDYPEPMVDLEASYEHLR